jgi:transposase InsO family protein
VRFSFVDAEKAHYPITVLCRVMGVSTSGYYAWANRRPSARARRDLELTKKILAFHRASRGNYGSPRIYTDLLAARERVGRKRVERLMRQSGIEGKRSRKFRCTTDSTHSKPVAPNLLKQRFDVDRPNVVWSSDITQLATPEGWLYLAVVLDLFARYVVGWALSHRITRHLVLDAVKMALGRRRPEPRLVFHSDKGSQYAAGDTRELLDAHGLRPSMSGTGNCFDNAVSESFFGRFKEELGDTFPSRQQARLDCFDYIEIFFNRQRRHSYNAYLTPLDTEQFFARHGRRPRGIDDLLAEDWPLVSLHATRGGGAVPSAQPCYPIRTAVRLSAREVVHRSL